MTSQVLNFLWLGLDLDPPDIKDGSTLLPMRQEYADNIRKAALRHPKAEIVLWVDSRRHTSAQWNHMQQTIETDLPNVTLQDLREIDDYDQNPLYNKAEETANWRAGGQSSTIWLQVDAAKVLISLQWKEYDQVFFADLDHAHLDIDSPEAQRMLEKSGLFIGSSSAKDMHLENQLWGFAPARRFGFFEEYYKNVLKAAMMEQNGYYPLLNTAIYLLENKEDLRLKDYCLLIDEDGYCAIHPGHPREAGGLDSISKLKKVTAEFNDKNGKRGALAASQKDVSAPAERPAPAAAAFQPNKKN